MGMSEGISSADRDYFTRVMDEAKEDRAHKERLAKIQAQKEVDLVKAKHDGWEQREWKRNMAVGITVGVFILAVIATFWYGVIRVHESDRVKFNTREAQQAEIAKECVKAGNIWIDQDCLLATKGQ